MFQPSHSVPHERVTIECHDYHSQTLLSHLPEFGNHISTKFVACTRFLEFKRVKVFDRVHRFNEAASEGWFLACLCTRRRLNWPLTACFLSFMSSGYMHSANNINMWRYKCSRYCATAPGGHNAVPIATAMYSNHSDPQAICVCAVLYFLAYMCALCSAS